MTDSLQTVISAIEKASNNGIDLINKVDSFYNSAWNKLIIFGSVAFAIIGILIPFVIQWYQNKTLKISEELLKKEIENQTSKIKAELLGDINIILEERISIFEQKIEKLNASANAKAFHLQGNSQLNIANISGALSDYIAAAMDYLVCEDYSNLHTVLRVISENCIQPLSYEEIMDLKISDNCDLENLLDKLENTDDKGMFLQLSRDIRIKLTKLPKTIKDKPQVK